jgi:hypothetical protein
MMYSKKVLLAKAESAYGTDSAPDGASNAMEVRNLEPGLMQGETFNRDLLRDHFGASKLIHKAPYGTLGFDIEIAGSGAAGTAPAYADLLKACGMSETVNAGASVVYAPDTNASDSVTLHYVVDGEIHKLVGARGSVALDIDADPAVYKFSFLGLRVSPSAITHPAATLTAFQEPVPVNPDNTSFTLHGYSAILESLSLDLGNDVQHRPLVNSDSIIIVGRQSSGSITIEAPAIGAKDYHSIIENHTLGALQMVHGVTAGNIVQIDAPQVQLSAPSQGDSQNNVTLSMTLGLLPNSGDDELTITVK